MKLSFSTLSCDLPFEKIVALAAQNGFGGIEVRGLEGELFLPRARAFQPDRLAESRALCERAGVRLVSLDTSCRFDLADGVEGALREGRGTIDLAERLGCPFVRVFGDGIDPSAGREDTVERVSRCLRALGEYAAPRSVTVLLETHGGFSASADALLLVERAAHPSVALLWDIEHTLALGEPIAESWARIGRLVRHVHLKDAVLSEGGAELCAIGQGNLPLRECVSLLTADGYGGFFSLEWEARWQPRLGPFEEALLDYRDFFRA